VSFHKVRILAAATSLALTFLFKATYGDERTENGPSDNQQWTNEFARNSANLWGCSGF
jgi:hypothetical protein